ncbi:MAG: hypothetical protein PHC50_10255 [Candidatus Cloacimonetes bacterium]|nr:hypothetical protein [Candidatus Cloacimonadota bacterium]
MKLQAVVIALLAILAIVFGVLWMNSSKEIKDYKLSNEELQSLYDNATVTIGEIQSNLEVLDQDLSGQLFTQNEIPGATPEDKRERLVNTINTMRGQIEADKKKISALEAQLANSKTQLKGVQDVVARLRTSIEEKERIMDELQERMGMLTENMEEERRITQREIAILEQISQQKDKQLQQAEYSESYIYYVVGTRKQLMEQGIVDRKGGLLGIGKVTTVTKNLKLERFSEINLKNTNEIRFPITKKGYSILSNHLATTYEVSKEGGEMLLRITDPDNFRKQKFLVIELL